MNYNELFTSVAHVYSKEIKKNDSLDPFAYMIISSSTTLAMFFEIVLNAETDDEKLSQISFASRKRFATNLNSLKKNEIRNAYKYFLYDYFAFVHNFMDKAFIDNFPIDFDQFENEFKSIFVSSKKDAEKFKKVLDNYDSAVHSRLLLSTLNYPSNLDDLFAIETLEELKKLMFHRFNDTITNYMRIKLRGEDEYGKKLRNL